MSFLHIIGKHLQQELITRPCHAGLLIEHLPLVKGRLTGIVSRGGASWPSGCCITTSRTLLFQRAS